MRGDWLFQHLHCICLIEEGNSGHSLFSWLYLLLFDLGRISAYSPRYIFESTSGKRTDYGCLGIKKGFFALEGAPTWAWVKTWASGSSGEPGTCPVSMPALSGSDKQVFLAKRSPQLEYWVDAHCLLPGRQECHFWNKSWRTRQTGKHYKDLPQGLSWHSSKTSYHTCAMRHTSGMNDASIE